MILIAQPHTGLPTAAEKRLRPRPTRTHPLADSSSSTTSDEQHPLLFIQPSPPPYVLPTPTTSQTQSGKRGSGRARDLCRVACGIATAFMIGLLGAIVCIGLYWDGFMDIISGPTDVSVTPRFSKRVLTFILICRTSPCQMHHWEKSCPVR